MTREYAKQQMFLGDYITYWLVSIGYGPQMINTTLYKFKLLDNGGNEDAVQAPGLDTNKSFSDQINLRSIAAVFP